MTNIKISITFGFIGYLNICKSSLINYFKQSLTVSAEVLPEVTRSSQNFHLDKSTRLIDCLGIVFSHDTAIAFDWSVCTMDQT